MRHFPISLLTAALMAAALAGCGDKNAPAGADPKPNLADATAPAAIAAIKQSAARAALPKADKATPADAYLQLDSGNQLMFSYLALAAMPIDYKEIAQSYSQDYARASDEFRKNDLLNALKPKIDANVAKAGAQRYLKMTIDNPLQAYDFDKKGFPLDASLWQAGSYRYFNDNSNYKIGFSNGDAFRYLAVASEDAARTIEAQRSKYEAIHLVVYGFVQDADVANKVVQAQIVKVELVDKKGTVLASQ